MKKRKAYLFTLKTDLSLERQMSRYAGSCRFVWNRALALESGQKVTYPHEGKTYPLDAVLDPAARSYAGRAGQ